MISQFSKKHGALFSKILPLIFIAGFFVLLFYGSRVHSQSLYFQDETDHIAMGWMMTEFDKDLYTEVSTNHQPIPVLSGAFLSSIFSYETLYQLIEQLRFSLFLFSFVASLLLSWRFGWSGAVASALTYSLAYLFFGWYLLAESLAVPAVIFMTLYVLELYISSDSKKHRSRPPYDAIAFGLAAFWAVFNLLPLIPFTFLAVALVLLKLSNKNRLLLISTGLAAVIVLSSIVNPLAWYEETVVNNSKYFLIDEDPFSAQLAVKLFFYPLQDLTLLNNDVVRSMLIPLLAVIAATGILISQSKISKKQAGLLVSLFLVISTTNMRVTDIPVVFYRGFHLYPYLAALFSFCAFGLTLFSKKFEHSKIVITVISIVVLGTLFNNTGWVWEKKDKLTEHFIQYGTQQSHATAMRMIADEGDTFFSAPNGHGYMNMVSGLPIAGRQLFHLQWAYRSPKLRAEFHELMRTDPPTFIYLTEDESGYHTDLVEILPNEYYPLLHNDNRSLLHIHRAKVDTLSEAQIRQLSEFQYEIEYEQLDINDE